MAGRSRGWKAGAGILIAATLAEAGREAAASRSPETGWTMRMAITVKGDYALEGLERERAAGRYRMKFLWTGGLEFDGDDYILVHSRSELEEWEAEESASSPKGIRLLRTDDFGAKPELEILYVLRRSDGLHVNFVIRGFTVPRSSDRGVFDLRLPASRENSERPSGINYSDFVKKGSNAVVLDDPAFQTGIRKKTFRWAWIHRTSDPRQGAVLLGTNRHEAIVTVIVSPVAEIPAAAGCGPDVDVAGARGGAEDGHGFLDKGIRRGSDH